MNSNRFHRANKMMPRNSKTAPAVLPYVAQMNAACNHRVAIRVNSYMPRMTDHLVHWQTMVTVYLHDSPPTHSSCSFQKCHLHTSMWFEGERCCAGVYWPNDAGGVHDSKQSVQQSLTWCACIITAHMSE